MREQTQELLLKLARLEDDATFDAPPFITKPTPRTEEVFIRTRRPSDQDETAAAGFKTRLSDLEELDRLDLIRSNREIGSRRCEIRLTASGRNVYEESKQTLIVLEPLLTGASDILDWHEQVLPVLRAAYDAYSRQPLTYGIPTSYVNTVLGRPEDDPRTNLVLASLAEDGYVVPTIDGEHGMPHMFKLGERGRQVVAGWPGGSDADRLAALLSSLDTLIEKTQNEDERGRLRHLRKAITDLGTDFAAKVLANIIAG